MEIALSLSGIFYVTVFETSKSLLQDSILLKDIYYGHCLNISSINHDYIVHSNAFSCNHCILSVN